MEKQKEKKNTVISRIKSSNDACSVPLERKQTNQKRISTKEGREQNNIIHQMGRINPFDKVMMRLRHRARNAESPGTRRSGAKESGDNN